MNRIRGCLLSFAVIACLLSSSCTIRLGEADASADAGTGEVGSFRRDDLAGIVLTAADAPVGTGYAQDLSGFQDLDAFARDAQERVDLIDDGFVLGHLALFGPAGWAGPGSGELPLDAPFATAITGLFETSDGAARAYARFGEDLRTRQFDRSADLPPPALGQESFALEGTSGGSALVIYVWRDDNLIVAISGAGVLEAGDVETLAALVRGRTDA